MDIEQMKAMAEAEREHVDRLQVSVEAWQKYLTVLSEADASLQNAATHTSTGWTDSAGELFDAKTKECSAAITARRDAVVRSNVQNVLSTLMGVIEREYNAVMAAYDAYKAAEKILDVPGMEKALQDAAAALRRMGAEFHKAEHAVQQAVTPRGQSPAGSPAMSGAAPSSATASGASPSGASPSGGSPSGAAPAAAGSGAPAGAAPAPAGAGTGPAPSLAGAAAPAPAPPVAPVKPIVPSLQPVSPLPPIAPIASAAPRLGGVSPVGTGPSPVKAVPGQVAIPKAAGTVAQAAAVPPVGTPPQLPAAAGPRATGGQSPGMAAVPPMAHGMAGGASCTGAAPKPGDAEKPVRRTAKPPRAVPGVPPELRGRAGKLDGRQSFLFPAARPVTRDSDDKSVQLVDEDLWHVGDTKPHHL
ncbi:hypothetical protein [Lentzea albidocapillata]|uniref:hypothetical protein n=1 Tax=Lentzea albidocapillata TaxID=40571 RepID=UPI000B7D871F|nr:hypothetical protein [Lentzea albidocapillata]